MTLHPCFQPASLNSPPHSPTKAGATIRIGSRRVTNQETVWRSSLEAPADSGEELSGGTGDSVAELSGTEPVRGDLTTELHLHRWLLYNYSNRIRRLQPRQPALQHQGTLNVRALVQQYPRRFLENGSSVVGRLTRVVVPFNSWFGPAHFDLMSQERSGATSASTRGALWCHALGKRKGI